MTASLQSGALGRGIVSFAGMGVMHRFAFVEREGVGEVVGDGHMLFRLEQRAAREPPLRGERGRATVRSPLQTVNVDGRPFDRLRVSGQLRCGKLGVRRGERGRVTPIPSEDSGQAKPSPVEGEG